MLPLFFTYRRIINMIGEYSTRQFGSHWPSFTRVKNLNLILYGLWMQAYQISLKTQYQLD